ncbi:MAG TPA: DUF4270 family protein [Flavisolibacter sp.]|nr:DUF4270 family protein [Flavisolibacter sp.]
MKSKGLLALFSFVSLCIFFSCTKINEATELGDELIPAVDNVNTFETTLDVTAAYHPFDDSSRLVVNSSFTDYMALGRLNDPLFGTTTADMYFNVGNSAGEKVNPFGVNVKDSIKAIDSVVLSIAYVGGYGDTTAASQLSVEVREMATNNTFDADSLYRFDENSFATTGPVLGSRTFSVRDLKDSLTIIRGKDTSRLANVLRVRFNNNAIGERLRSYDTSNSAIGAFFNDSLFRRLLKGFEIKTTNAANNGALAYFNLLDAKTSLTVYCRIGTSTGIDTTAVNFRHVRNGQANAIRRTPSVQYLAGLNQPAPQRLFVQSSPTGSYVGIKVAGLDTFPNKVIHRAELIAYKEADPSDITFKEPVRLLLDHKRPLSATTPDTAYIFENDLSTTFDGSLNFASFGGNLRSDNSYRFNITRYVQGIVTRKERNDSLRLYAPLRSLLYAKTPNQYVPVQILDFIAKGRVVLNGATAPDPTKRMRLRIIYSNL